MIAAMLACTLLAQNPGHMKVVKPQANWELDTTAYNGNICRGTITDSIVWDKKKYYVLSDYHREKKDLYFPCVANKPNANYMLHLSYNDSAGNKINTQLPGLVYSYRNGVLHGTCIFYTKQGYEAIFIMEAGKVINADHYRDNKLAFSFHYNRNGQIDRYSLYWANTEIRYEINFKWTGSSPTDVIAETTALQYDKYGTLLLKYSCGNNTITAYNRNGSIFSETPLSSGCDFSKFYAQDKKNNYILPPQTAIIGFASRRQQ